MRAHHAFGDWRRRRFCGNAAGMSARLPPRRIDDDPNTGGDDPNVIDDAIVRAERLCFFSHFDADGRIDDYVLHYLGQLRDAGFVVLFVTTATLAAGKAARVEGLCAAVVERDNVGLDFGGWVECLARFPDIRADLLLLCNDSVYGPFWSLAEFVAELTAVPADFYGAVCSLGPAPHLQSWFLLLRPAAFRSEAFRSLMAAPVAADASKSAIIARYETALTPRLVRAGLRYHAAFDPATMGPVLAATPLDPAYTLWRELLSERLVPFVKIRLLRDRPATVRGLGGWRRVAARRDPALTELAARNLDRRMTRPASPRIGLLRQIVLWPTMPLAHLPMAHGVLAREVRGPAAGPRRGGCGFAAAERVYDIVRTPYVWAYRAID